MATRNELVAHGQKTVGKLLADNFKAIQSVLPRHLTPEKMARLVLTEIQRNPRVGQCTSDSLLGAVLVASQAGLEIGPFGYAYLIPRKNGATDQLEVNFQLGYKGAMKLAWNSGKVGGIMPQVVYETDHFEFSLGTDPFIRHVPGQGQPGKITHFYCTARNLDSNEMMFRVLTKWEVDYIRDSYAQGTDKASSPWVTAYDGMGMKTSIVRLCKYLPMSAEAQRIISLDEMADTGVDQNLGLEVPVDFRSVDVSPSSQARAATEQKTNNLKDKLRKEQDKKAGAGDATGQGAGEDDSSSAEPTADTPTATAQPAPETPQDDFPDMEKGQLWDYLLTNKTAEDEAAVKALAKKWSQRDAIALCRSMAKRMQGGE